MCSCFALWIKFNILMLLKCLSSFHIFIGYLNIHFGEIFIQSFIHFVQIGFLFHWFVLISNQYFIRGTTSFLFLFILFYREGKGERKRETSMCGCLSCASYWRPGLQPRHVQYTGNRTSDPLEPHQLERSLLFLHTYTCQHIIS